jgi:hypothetical protein
VVGETGKGAPFLGEAVRKGLAAARAVVVLMTPEDVVHLHPDLYESREAAAETETACRPARTCCSSSGWRSSLTRTGPWF